jgi:hypothetical protein
MRRKDGHLAGIYGTFGLLCNMRNVIEKFTITQITEPFISRIDNIAGGIRSASVEQICRGGSSCLIKFSPDQITSMPCPGKCDIEKTDIFSEKLLSRILFTTFPVG